MLKKINLKKNSDIWALLFFSIYLVVGILIYKDFGIGIEEHFQRKNGFFWLKSIFSLTNFEQIKETSNFKYQEILLNNPNLPDTNFFNFYGVTFDLPLALIETLFRIEESKSYFEIRHLFTFIIFFISSIYFFKILKNRFNNSIIIFLGVFFYTCTPRIFGDSFHNNKDLLFLSILTISISYLFDFLKNRSNKYLILFCLFSALATSSRIMGIYLPLLLIIFNFLEYLSRQMSTKIFFLNTAKILFFFILFLYLHYPYIWELNFFNLKTWLSSFFYWMDIQILFNGDYYKIKYLPRSYLPVWIFISTPIIILLFFLIGSLKVIKIFFERLINIKKNFINKKGDLWNSFSEKKDLFILISFLSFFFYAVFLNVAMLSGWRHFYFLHLYIVYISTIGIDYIFNYLEKKFNSKIIFLITFFISIYLIFINFKFHPFQSLYFSDFLNKNFVSKFQIDSPSLSRTEAIKFILDIEKNNQQMIRIANASWTPMNNGKDLLIENKKRRLIFVGQEFSKADYIYDNYVLKSDEKYNKSYKIPSNFIKIKELIIDNVLIYSLYKRKN